MPRCWPIFMLLVVVFVGVNITRAAVLRGNADDFLISKWTTEQGLPQNTVTSITQTSDGYLWLGTFGGLARFDGIRFTVFDATNTPNFKANRVLSIQRNPKGGLWVGTDSGQLYTIRGNELTEFVSGLEFERTAVWDIEQDIQNCLYVSSTSGIESYLLDESGWPIPGSGRVLARGEAYSLNKDRNGRVWAKIGGDIVLLDRTATTNISSLGYKLPLSTYYVAFDGIGRLFVVASASLGELSLNRYREVMSLDYTIHRSGSSIEYAAGRIWFQQANELYEIEGTELTVHDLGDYVRTGSRAIFEDNEGNIWIATQTDGLVRLSPRKIGSTAAILGKDLTGVYSVAEDASQTIWFTGARLTGVKGDQIRQITKVSDGSAFPGLRTLLVDLQDRLWAGGIRGLYYLKEDELVPLPEFAKLSVQSLFLSERGDLWIGTDVGLFVRQGENVLQIASASGLPPLSVHFITQDRNGTVWAGTKNGIARVDPNSMMMDTGPSEFAGDFVRAILPFDDGTIWVGTYGGGLKRLKDGTVSTLSTANGLPNNFISRILLADDGKFWILTNVGIFVITREELERVADRSEDLLGGAVFGVSDGMRSSEANGGNQPAGIRSSDGRLWFPMIDDLVSIDPKDISGQSPRIVIENATSRASDRTANGLPLDFDSSRGLEIDYGVRNLAIEYSGISLTKPEAVRYVYRLEGLDSDWVFAGNRRTAFYPYLPAGNYHFVVRAIGADGVWSEPASIEVRVAERFWESRWFVSLLFVAVLAIVAFAFWRRLQQLKDRQLRKTEFARQLINASEAERRRMATELHDGLSQNLLLMKRWAELASIDHAAHSTASGDYVEKIESLASQSIDETRTIIQNLGPQNLKRFGLTDSIISISEQVEDAFGVVLEKEIENIDGLLDEEGELSLYRMAQESINNLIKHSGSPRGRLVLKQEGSWILYSLTDFGVGMSEDQTGGNGLRNLEERSDLLGGSFTIESGSDHGTTVTIRIPTKQ